MIQIDGLSRVQFEKGLAAGRMKFLSRMIGRGALSPHSFYSGLPSTTPAVQGEIFYNVRTAVPAFEFLHRKSGEVFRMFDPAPAEVVENQLAAKGAPPLLAGGRVYSDIYRAGAAVSHYCSQDLTARRIGKAMLKPRWLLIGLLHSIKILRMIFLALVEVALAVVDFARGLCAGENPWRELLTVPARVFICILLREYIRFRVLLDLEEGARVIHANFLGYDEQSHRRGPSSSFAHWTLTGIDRAIRDIHRAAMRSEARDYELIVYSDHGQEKTVPYAKHHGRALDVALAEVFSEGPLAGCEVLPAGSGKRAAGETGAFKSRPQPDAGDGIIVAAMGPLGHVYLPRPQEPEVMQRLARTMVSSAGVPQVLWREGETVRGWNRGGGLELPRDLAEVIGAQHPFAREISDDLPALVKHRDAGEFVLLGYDPHGTPLSFPPENGAHAGPGPEETHGFLLLPDALDHEPPALRSPIRGSDLYELAGSFLNEGRPLARPHRQSRREVRHLRVMTYNIHSCVGMDGRLRPERVARAINRYHPDIVAVQEVDAHRARSGKFHQAELLAEHLEFHHVFQSMLEEKEEKYGIAVFSSLPFETKRADLLTPAGKRPLHEARGAIWLHIETPGGKVHFLNTHFGLGADERNRQAAEILSPEWLGGIPADEPVILCGDFNSTARSVAWRRLDARLPDVQNRAHGHRRVATFPSFRPLAGLDHIFASAHFQVRAITVPHGLSVAMASDHLPLIADLEWKPE